ncbi:MAG: formylglycine-generating enzyme family protein [Planctomycetota bacterium]|jgi:formylglycine-generating enzyme required for sulfatase activity
MMRRTSLTAYLMCLVVVLAAAETARADRRPKGKEYINSIGMKLVRIEPGEFQMGQIDTPLPSEILPIFRGRGLFDTLNEGDYDEKPLHTVKITRPLYMGVVEVTNYQFELFRPEHKTLRGKEGFSKDDDEAVTFVNWFDAVANNHKLSHRPRSAGLISDRAKTEGRRYSCTFPEAGPDTAQRLGTVQYARRPRRVVPRLVRTI